MHACKETDPHCRHKMAARFHLINPEDASVIKVLKGA